jgi:glycosyltransferase involved in cell wall biosynthesis
MRVAVWTPLPPEPSGIADYNAHLLAMIARDPDVQLTAIVRDEARDETRAPFGVAVCAVSEYREDDFDIDLYHLGNNPTFHSYMFQPLLNRPGVVVLHDPAIADFVEVLLGGRWRRIFELEAAYNLGVSEFDDRVAAAIGAWERTDLLMSRRVVETSIVTLVHSSWAAAYLRERFGVDNVVEVPFAVSIDPTRQLNRSARRLTFSVFGNISFHKRVPEVVEAFIDARRQGLDANLIVAGRRDSVAAEVQIQHLIDDPEIADSVVFAVDVDEAEFRSLQESCDVMIGLRWPTAGETSASLMECFALGKSAIVSDIPQMGQFSDDFCLKVSTDPRTEHDELVAAMLAAGADVEATRAAGRRALAYVSENCRIEHVATIYLEHLRRATDEPRTRNDPVEGPLPLGVNAIASWAGATGLAEAGRRAAIALLNEGVAMAVEDVNLWAKVDQSRVPDQIAALPHGHPYPIGLSFLNINEFHVVEGWQLRGHGTPYLIAMWYWELPALPPEMVKEIDRVDEIWVASEFVRDVFLRYTVKPIHVMPCVVEPEADESLTRSDLGLPEDAVIYLVTFDANSTIARKNPYGAIKAFEEAFGPGRTDVVLVIKVINLSSYPVVQRDLRRHMERLGGILIESNMAPGEIAALIRHCDVYVSLHRSEGFGLGLAEAMYFGHPVVATGNSGNMDFMNAANSCLVGYRSMEVHRNELSDNPTAMVLYQPGNLWVDPDVHEAARLMRWLFENPAERARIGAKASADIKASYGLAAAGRAMHARLVEIATMLEGPWVPEENLFV